MKLVVLKEKIFTKKNIILFICIIILLIIVAALLIILSRKKEIEFTNTLLTFKSKDSNVTLTISSSYNFSEIDSEKYELYLKSNDYASEIYISKVTINNIRDLNKFIESDKNDYISKFSNISQVSNISEQTILEKPTYNYNFYYRKNMYVDVYWIKIDNTFYLIDFNLNAELIDTSSFIQEVLQSLTIN